MIGPQRTTAVLIAGMHRSGTSALAGALSQLGIPMGARLLEPGPDNPKGYWEHADAVAAHEQLLAALGSRWDDVRPLPTDWMTSDAAHSASKSIEALIDRDFAQTSVWAVKDPRLCRLLPLWFKALHRRNIRPAVLLMARKPSEVAASIEARNQWRSPIGEMLWVRYVIEAERASRSVSRAVVLYDDLLSNPLSTVMAALDAVNVRADSMPEDARQALAQCIDRSDRHHAHTSTANGDPEFAAIAERIYQALVAIAHGGDEWATVQTGADEFEHQWQGAGSATAALADMSGKLAADARLLGTENFALSSKLVAQIRWSDEASIRHEALQSENASLSSRLNAQLRWSKDAEEKLAGLQADAAELRSKLTAQIRWSDEAQADREALRAANAKLTESLHAQVALSKQLRAERDSCARGEGKASTQLAQVEAALAQATHEAAAKLQASTSERSRLDSELRRVYASTSWRLTRPLRCIADLIRKRQARNKASSEERS